MAHGPDCSRLTGMRLNYAPNQPPHSWDRPSLQRVDPLGSYEEGNVEVWEWVWNIPGIKHPRQEMDHIDTGVLEGTLGGQQNVAHAGRICSSLKRRRVVASAGVKGAAPERPRRSATRMSFLPMRLESRAITSNNVPDSTRARRESSLREDGQRA